MSTEQELSLLPCPFCGGEVGFHQDNDECKQGCHYIDCGNCGLFDFSDSADPDNKVETLVELRSRIVPLWNKREGLIK